MEKWLFFSLIGVFFTGISNFSSKIIAEKGINKNRVTLYSFIPFFILPIIYFFINGFYLELGFITLGLIIARVILATEKKLCLIEGLKNIESSILLPFHKIIQVFLAFFVGMILFDEFLSFYELLSMCSGLAMIFFLNSKNNKKVQKNYIVGLKYLFLANFLLIFSSTINKYITTINFDIIYYMFLSAIFGSFYIIMIKKDIFIKVNKIEHVNELKIGIISGTLKFIGFLSFLTALSKGPFVLVQLMQLSTVLIPVILSIIFFDEKINLQKILAFICFLITIVLISF